MVSWAASEPTLGSKPGGCAPPWRLFFKLFYTEKGVLNWALACKCVFNYGIYMDGFVFVLDKVK